MSYRRGSLRTFTGVSSANTAKTHTITSPAVSSGGPTKPILLHSLTVSTGGADLASDCTVAVQDNAVEKWKVELRSGKVFGGHFDFSGAPIFIRDGDLRIVTDAGGASVVVTVSAVYSIG